MAPLKMMQKKFKLRKIDIEQLLVDGEHQNSLLILIQMIALVEYGLEYGPANRFYDCDWRFWDLA